MPHRRKEDERGLPEIHVDYCFMGTSEEDGVRTIVVAKHAESRAVMSSIVPVKGAAHELPAKRIKAFVRELGLEHCKVVLKSDQEPALLDLLNEVARLRAPAQTIPEQSPARSSASNGRVERGIQAVEGQIRVMKDALEFRIKESVPGNHSVMAWLVEYAGVLINRYEVGHDGKTPYERLKGKKSKMLGLEFGEKVHYRMQAIGGKMAKLDVMWEDGIFTIKR